MASQGSVVSGSSSVAASATYNIQPTSGVEWTVMNIYYTGAVSIAIVDGANTIPYDSDSTSGGKLGGVWNLSSTHYIRITNTGSTAIIVSFDGKQTSA